MSTLSKLRFVPALALTVLAACGGGGGGGSTPGVQLPPSMLSPLPGQLTGNWVLNNINVVQGTGIGGIRTGMNLRLSASSVEVFLGDYVGADSILPKLMKDWFGSELNLQQAVTGTSFTLSLRSDFGRVFNLDPLKWYTTVDVTGQLTGSNVVVTMTNNDYLPNNAAPITNVVELTFGPGQNVVPLSGNWQVSQVSQVSSLAFPLTQAQLAPLPNEVVAGRHPAPRHDRDRRDLRHPLPGSHADDQVPRARCPQPLRLPRQRCGPGLRCLGRHRPDRLRRHRRRHRPQPLPHR
jgi:hypothetical protein